MQVTPFVWFLVILSFANAVYAITRTRKYRLFEASVETKLSTPSARRVKAQSSPATSSPLQYIADMVAPESAEARAHPDKNRDVWELSVWDPLPMSLQLMCLFGPGHVLVYLLFLPLAPLDPRPSVTVFNTMVMEATLSGLLLLLSSCFAQQAKDTAIISKEVMHEYDTKFVHPRLHPVVRDVGTQCSEDQPAESQEFVQIGTPTTLIRRSFHTHPNPNYANLVDSGQQESPHHTNVMRPQMFTPPAAIRPPESYTPVASQRSSGLRQSLPAGYIPTSVSHNSFGSATADNSTPGGNMGIHSHRNSPLKKTISLNDINNAEPSPSPRNSREMAAYEQRNWERPTSPTKHSDSRRPLGSSITSSASTNSLANVARNRAHQERYPARW
jgi:hypothetical protein